MASIHRRGTRWRVIWRDPDGRQHSRTCPDTTTARALAREVEQQVALGRSWEPRGPGPQPTALMTVAEAWLREESTRLAPATLRRYAEALDLLLRWLRLGKRAETASALSLSTLSEWRTWLTTAPGRHGRFRTPTTADQSAKAVELMWRWAEETERWPDVPRPRRLRRVRTVRTPVRAPAWPQVDAMLDELVSTTTQYGHRAPQGSAPAWILRLTLLARYLGGRRDELMRARWERYDATTHVLELPHQDTKGGYGGRLLPIPPALTKQLGQWLVDDIGEGRDSGRIVASPEAELTGRGHADRLVRRAWGRANIPRELWHGRPLHSLRRCLRTHLVTVGTQADVIDAVLGHTTAGTGARHYTDRAALLPAIRRALETVPAWTPPAALGSDDGPS